MTINITKYKNRIRSNAGARYTPEVHTPLAIEDNLYALVKDESFLKKLEEKYHNLNEESKYFHRWNEKHPQMNSLIIKLTRYNHEVFHKYKNHQTVRPLQRAKYIRSIADVILQEEKIHSNKEHEEYSNYLYSVRNAALALASFLETEEVHLFNSNRCLILGEAMMGKTHLLSDFAIDILNKNQDALILYGNRIEINKSLEQNFFTETPFFDSFVNFDGILEQINQKAIKNNYRAPLIIDGLNECEHRYIKEQIKLLEKKLRQYSNLVLIISIRSGYEDLLLSKGFRKNFVEFEHYGFGEEEVQKAYDNFCDYYKVKKSEVPLLNPEFNNPLFLKMFCKTHENRKSTKGGYVYLTDLFEDFIIGQSLAVLKRLKVTQPEDRKTEIWTNIIKPMAEEMIYSTSRHITHKELLKIIKSYDRNISSSEMIRFLENEGLIVSYRWDSTKTQYGFTYNKFSDHLIVRTLLGQSLIKNGRKDAFKKDGKIYEFVEKFNYDYGLLEALCVQIPEWLKAEKVKEIFDLIPKLKKSNQLFPALLKSLIWRKPETIDDRIIQIIKKNFKAPNGVVIDCLLQLGINKNHPLNSKLLHSILISLRLPERDAAWSTSISQTYTSSPIDRILKWSQNADLSTIDTHVLNLSTIILAWLQASPNKLVKDKATMGLINILTYIPTSLGSLFNLFKDCDDPYISDGIAMSIYATIIRTVNSTKKNIYSGLIENIYEYYFKGENLPISIIGREYLRNIIEVGIAFNIIKDEDGKISQMILPKNYTSDPDFLDKAPSTDELKSKYRPDNMKYGDDNPTAIWSSVMYHVGSLADFGNYTLGSNTSNWSGKRKDMIYKPMEEKIKDFKTSLNTKSLSLWKKIYEKESNSKPLTMKISIRTLKNIDSKRLKIMCDEIEKGKQENIEEFSNSLSTKQLTYYTNELKPFIDESGRIRDPLENFDDNKARNWVFNRVLELGWSSNLHGAYDREVYRYRAGRQDGASERIGKKYQKIALSELLARINDNYYFKGMYGSTDKEYKGLWQLTIKGLDPTCTINPEEKTKGNIALQNYYKSTIYDSFMPQNDITWLENKNDLPDPSTIVEIEADNKDKWLLLEGIYTWREPLPLGTKELDEPSQELYYFLKSYLVAEKDFTKLKPWLNKQDFMGRWMPETIEFHNLDLAQFPWSNTFSNICDPYYGIRGWKDLSKISSQHQPPKIEILTTADEYTNSGGESDYSRENFSLYLPNQLIVKEMNLVYPTYDSTFINDRGEIIFIDPWVQDHKLPHLLISKKTDLLKFLNDKGYIIFWTLIFEKNILSDNNLGRTEGSGVLYFDADKLNYHQNVLLLPKNQHNT